MTSPLNSLWRPQIDGTDTFPYQNNIIILHFGHIFRCPGAVKPAPCLSYILFELKPVYFSVVWLQIGLLVPGALPYLFKNYRIFICLAGNWLHLSVASAAREAMLLFWAIGLKLLIPMLVDAPMQLGLGSRFSFGARPSLAPRFGSASVIWPKLGTRQISDFN